MFSSVRGLTLGNGREREAIRGWAQTDSPFAGKNWCVALETGWMSGTCQWFANFK